MVDRPVAARAVADALANLGTHEDGASNSGKWVDLYLGSTFPPTAPGAPWCAAFVCYRFRTAGHELGKIVPMSWPRSALAADYKHWAVTHSCWVRRADAQAQPSLVTPGDLVCFFSSRQNRVYHIGIVAEVHPWGVVTVEGNTSPDADDGQGEEVEANGGQVCKKHRRWDQLGLVGGFARCGF